MIDKNKKLNLESKIYAKYTSQAQCNCLNKLINTNIIFIKNGPPAGKAGGQRRCSECVA